MADARRLLELSMVPRLAQEVAAQITSGVGDKRRLLELTMVPRLAQEVAAQITAKVGDKRRLVELGMPTRLSSELATQIGSVGGAQRLLLDSDYDSDIDDLYFHMLALELERRGECQIIGTVVASNNIYAVAAMKAATTRVGRGTIPFGAYMGTAILGGNGSTYDQPMVTQFGNPTTDTRANYPDAVTTMRTALAASPDASVKIACGGTATNLAALLQSAADGISTLTGVQLVAAKVISIHFSAGSFADPTIVENNIAYDVAAANVLATSPVPVIFSGLEIGGTINTKMPATPNMLGDPFIFGWNLGATGGLLDANGERPSWDHMVILNAIRGSAGIFEFSAAGNVSFSATSPYTNFTANAAGKIKYLTKTATDADIKALCQSLVTSYDSYRGSLTQDFAGDALWAKFNVTLTADVRPDAAGGMTGDLINEGTATGIHSIGMNAVSISGKTYHFEFDIEYIDAPFGQFVLGGTPFSTNAYFNVNLADGTLGTVGSAIQNIVVTTPAAGIKRYAFDSTCVNGSVAGSVSFGHTAALTSARNFSYAGTSKRSGLSKVTMIQTN